MIQLLPPGQELPKIHLLTAPVNPGTLVPMTTTETPMSGTLHLDGSVATFRGGYQVGGVVSLHEVLIVPAHNTKDLTPEAIRDLYQAEFETHPVIVMNRRIGARLYIGYWEDPSGDVHIEPTRHIGTYYDARLVAFTTGQEAIYDWENKKVIYIKEGVTTMNTGANPHLRKIQLIATPRHLLSYEEDEINALLSQADLHYDDKHWHLLLDVCKRLITLYLDTGNYPEAGKWLERASDAHQHILTNYTDTKGLVN